MRKELWSQILAYDLDKPMSEYGFSIRLAHENKWPVPFAENAILEYKKFMYLAATSGAMVSPSEIVDIVWHQHLLFTQSYNEFCQILGKKVEHIPSTHNKEETEKFAEARRHTSAHYKEAFGEQPYAFWGCDSIHDSFNLPKSKMNVLTFIPIGFVGILLLAIPGSLLLKDFYSSIDSNIFLPVFLLICGWAFFLLESFNRKVLRKFVHRLGSENFLHKLSPIELTYMRFEDVEDLVHITLDRLIREKKVRILADRRLELAHDFECRDARELAVKDYLGTEKCNYSNVVYKLSKKTVFLNTEYFVKNLKQQFMKTRLFMTVFVTSFLTLGVTFLIGWVRLLTGITRGKPILFIAFLLVALMSLIVYYLTRTMNILTKVTIPHLYKKTIQTLPFVEKTYEWKFFFHGQTALTAAFLPVVQDAYYQNHQQWAQSTVSGSSGGCSSSGGSSGSGCGSSCGGCGGCGG